MPGASPADRIQDATPQDGGAGNEAAAPDVDLTTEEAAAPDVDLTDVIAERDALGLRSAVIVGNPVVIPAGSAVTGVVRAARRSA